MSESKRVRGSTFYFLEDPSRETSAVLNWFRDLQSRPDEIAGNLVTWLNFGSLVRDSEGEFDQTQSPLVGFCPPRIVRGKLWTVGEVHFTPTAASPGGKMMAATLRAFRKWLSTYKLVYAAPPNRVTEFEYYLEGSVRNWASEIYALPDALQALERGQYFISDKDNEFVVEKTCRTLALRGVACDPAQSIQTGTPK